MLILAAIAAAVSVGVAIWSFFGFRPLIEIRAQLLSQPVADNSAAHSPSPSPGGSPSPVPTSAIEIVPDDYRLYENEKFDFSIAYPANFLIPQGETPNGDRQRFISMDGRVVMEVSATPKSTDESLKEIYQAAGEWISNRAGSVTYKVRKDDWFVISGYEGKRIFYQKTILDDGILKTFRIECDEEQKKILQPMTEKIARSFKG
jgi:hypothetical protein